MTPVSTLIRDFRSEDFETLWRMDQECFPPEISYSRQELRAYIRNPGTFTSVAVDQTTGEAQGFIVVHAGSAGHIITIDVSAKARRAGIGGLLLHSAEAKLRSTGASAVNLETAVDNRSALAFYKKHGYHVIRTWPRYYSNGVDALVMEKLLATSSE